MRIHSTGNVGINQATPMALLDVNGTFKLTDGTQAAGRVLTSNAAGNASWQAPVGAGASVGFKVSGLTGMAPVPNFTFVPITSQWTTVEYINNPLDYNAATGIYTASVAGTYHVNAQVLWNQPGATGSGYAGICLFKNGSAYNCGFDNMTNANSFSGNKLGSNVRMAVGDQLRIQIFHNTSGSVNLNGGTLESSWSVDLVK